MVATSHGREEVGNETCSDRVKHCRHRDEGVDERQNMETDELAGNEFAGVEYLVQQPMEKITETSIPDRGMNQTMNLSTRSTRCRKPGSV